MWTDAARSARAVERSVACVALAAAALWGCEPEAERVGQDAGSFAVAADWVGGAVGLAHALGGDEPVPAGEVRRAPEPEREQVGGWLGWASEATSDSAVSAVERPSGPVRVHPCYWSTVVTYDCGFWGYVPCSYTLCLHEQEWWDFCHDADRDGYANNFDRLADVVRYVEDDGRYVESWAWRLMYEFSEEWGTCAGAADCNDGDPEINPGANEACDAVDQDCDGDGYTDADSDWFDYPVGDACNTGEPGRCREGVVVCADEWSSYCAGVYEPIAETCNDIDDDCNGAIDDGRLQEVFYDGDGDGFGTWGTSLDSICPLAWHWSSEGGDCDDGSSSISPASPDMCNAIDDDCNPGTSDGDGDPDVLFTRRCDTGEPGRCASGTWACVSGTKVCEPTDEPRVETCENPGFDDDCNGEVDDVPTLGDPCDADDPDSCTDDVIQCTSDGLACVDRSGGEGDRVEVCDGLDNDCDSDTPDGLDDRLVGLACDAGDENSCADDVQACVEGGVVCIDVTEGDEDRVEICDGLDNDCDGTTDEAPPVTWYWDADRDGFGLESMVWTSVCPPGDARNVLVGGDCDDADSEINPAAPEICDGVDNDCDVATTDGAGDDSVGAVGDALLYPGAPHCQASVTMCTDGLVQTAPDLSDGTAFGDVETVVVPDGIIVADTGEIGAGSHLMTADERYAYALSYRLDGGVRPGWRYVAYDPRRDWSVVFDREVRGASYESSGLLSDGTYLYPIPAEAGGDVDRVRIDTGEVSRSGALRASGAGDCGPLCELAGGQVDVGRATAALGSAVRPRVTTFRGLPWQPPSGVSASFSIAGIPMVSWEDGAAPGAGLGVVATDGTFGFAKTWGDESGPREFIRFGVGAEGTSRGSNEGRVPSGSTSTTLTAFEFDGWVYEAGASDGALTRTRVSGARVEACDGTDGNCNGVVDDEGALGCVDYWTDLDGDGWGVEGEPRCLCAPSGFYRGTEVGDCDDRNPLINPGIVETPGDGVDSDCDELEACYVDLDGDGWRTDEVVLSDDFACPSDEGFAPVEPSTLDCDDGDPGISPEADEVCDGRDNDCDGASDEGFGAIGSPCDATDDGVSCLNGTVVCSADGASTSCSDGAVASYDFDEGEGGIAFNQSGPLSLLQLRNGATFADGVSGAALSLDGEDDHARTSEFGRWAGRDLSVSLWFAADLVAASHLISSGGDGGGAGCCEAWAIRLDDDGHLIASVGDEPAVEVRSVGPIAAGAWTHVAATMSQSGFLQLFVDGEWQGAASIGAVPAIGYAIIGAQLWSGSVEVPFAGRVDEVLVLPAAVAPDVIDGWVDTPGIPVRHRIRELCDGLDNDCNGVADDPFVNLGDDCEDGEGACIEAGTFVCNAVRTRTECSAEGRAPTDEICNGVDDDCDDATDEALSRACSTTCGTGTEFCAEGAWIACDAPPAFPERCDDIDHDCVGGPLNGFDLGIECLSGLGECAVPGFTICAADGTLGCDGVPLEPGVERCDDLDHDCDGDPTNGFGAGEPCVVGVGVCAVEGTRVCLPDGTADCDAVALEPVLDEICGNGEDDDCDGSVDENGGLMTVSMVSVWSGDPEFDYALCEITSGEEPHCSGVRFTIENIGVVDIPAETNVEVFVDDAGTRSDVSEPVPIGRAIAPGDSDTFVLCWENPMLFRDVDVGVSVDGACAIAEAVTGGAEQSLGSCGPEECDGFDNDADGDVDERGEACPLVTQECFYDPLIGSGYMCVNALSGETCESLGCPFGESCVDEVCIRRNDGGCSDGECPDAHHRYSAADGPPPNEPEPGAAGCSTTRSTSASWWLIGLLGLAWRRSSWRR